MWPDGWTAVTADGKRSAQFEHTLLVRTFLFSPAFHQIKYCNIIVVNYLAAELWITGGPPSPRNQRFNTKKRSHVVWLFYAFLVLKSKARSLCAEKEKFLPLRFYIVIIDKWFCCYATFILCSWLRVFGRVHFSFSYGINTLRVC
jgi:hypothetical protein